MTVKEGDLVRFLNATGGGTVTRIDTHKGTVYVKDETGFEIPARLSEVVTVTEGSGIVPKPEPYRPKSTAQEPQKPAVTKEKETRPRNVETQDKINAYLCFLPEEGKKPGEGNFEAFIVNDSQYDLLVVYTSGDDNARRTLRYHGLIPFDSIEQIDTIPQGKELDRRARSSFSLIPVVREGSFPRKDPFFVEIKVEGGKFFKSGAFTDNDFFDEKALIYPLVEDNRPLARKKINAEVLAEKMTTKNEEPKSRARQGEARRTPGAFPKNGPLVIDLHAAELLDNTRGMDNKAILDYQLAEVRDVMKEHRKPADKGMKIIFIHGKGEGILRQAVWDLIKKEFPRCELRDASFQEYGFGATQVTVR